jgi:type I restriction enzyme M protein
VTKDKRGRGKRDRSGETLFIDARKLGVMRDRVRRELTGEELERIAATYHAWRGDKGAGDYEDVAGFCKGATTEEIRENGYVLTPGRYVGAEEVEDDEEPFEERMGRLVRKLRGQFAESAKLEKEIRENFKELGL